MELPETIEGCLNLLRDIEHGGINAIPRCARDDWNRARRKMTALCETRFNKILNVVEESSCGGAACAPDSTSLQLLRYVLFQKHNSNNIYPWDKTICYQYLGMQCLCETASFQYEVGMDNGYPEYEYIVVPTEWLICDEVSLREKVLSVMFNDLCEYIKKIEEDFASRQDAHAKIAFALSKYMPMEDVSKLASSVK